MVTQKMIAAIKESLPEMVADELKEFITQAKKDASSLKDAKNVIETQEKEIEKIEEINRTLLQELEGMKTQFNKCEDCNERYAELPHIEERLRIQVANSDNRVYDMKELVSLVFKSPVFKKTVTTIIPVNDENGYYQRDDTKTETSESSEE